MERRISFRQVAACALVASAAAATARAQVPDQPGEGGKEVAPKVEAPAANPLQRAIRAVAHEAGRYVSDTIGFTTAPAHWTTSDWEKAGGFTVVLGGLLLADRDIDRATQRNRSTATNHLADATMPFGGGVGTEAATAAIGVGLIFRSTPVRDVGREALEASILTALIENYAMKPLFGRERPTTSGGKTDFDVASSNSSFPSGHATQAFTIASVVAARSKGWVVPTMAYTLASLVAYDRLNVRAHFSSDVFAGAVFGTVIGRYIVHKHDREATATPGEKTATYDVVPIRNGLAIRVAF